MPRTIHNIRRESPIASIFKNSAERDVLDLTEGTIYQILHTEKEEKCEGKIKNIHKN